MERLKQKQANHLQRSLDAFDTVSPSNVFSALGDPIRLRIIILLCWRQDLCVTDLNEILGISQPLVSHHLRILRQAGVVNVERMGQMQCPHLANTQIKRMVMNLINIERG